MNRAKLTCAICQPHYLPWIGYFEMIDRVDVFVLFNDVQFIKREWKNPNRIRKSPTGSDTKWLTVPVTQECQRSLLKDARISNVHNWTAAHFESLQHTYRNTSFVFDHLMGLNEISEMYRDSSLADLNDALVTHICQQLGITTRLIKSSELHVNGKREDKLLNICKAIGADVYLANNSTGQYVQAEFFQRDGVDFVLQDYQHPEYKQTWKGRGLPFLSHLSIVDLLFNQGKQSLEIIRKGRANFESNCSG